MDLVRAFKKANGGRHLVFMGYGDMENELKELARNHDHIHFKEAVVPDEIINTTSSADVGLFFNSDRMSLSYRMALPNKFYEYAIAGLFLVVSSNFIEQARIINEENLGVVIAPDINALVTFINNIDHDWIYKKRKESYGFRSHVSWEDNEKTLKAIYSGDIKLDFN